MRNLEFLPSRNTNDVTKEISYAIGYWLIIVGCAIVWGKNAWAIGLIGYGIQIILYGTWWKIDYKDE